MSSKKHKSPRHAVKHKPATAIPSVRPPAPSHTSVVEAIETAIEATRELAGERLREKLSISRLVGVERELKELLKVMSVYGA